MKIDESEEQGQNVYPPINESLEPTSNVMVERRRHPYKQRRPSFSTEAGMKSDEME
jgi:hypothetical protein